MCGFFFSSTLKKFNSNYLQPLMKIRGPDDFNSFDIKISNSRYLHVAHSRLKINTTGNVKQPFIKDNIIICFNGEIYNYFDTNMSSDSEVDFIYKSYKRSGFSCFRDFHGMFSIVIIDLEINHIFLARDYVGQKPLFYVIKDKEFFVSSDQSYLPSLWAHECHKVDKFSIVNFGFALPLGDCRTVQNLSPNTAASFDLIGNFCESEFLTKPQFTSSSNHSDLSSVLEKILDQTIPNHDFGIFVSGGLDSRTILKGAVELGRKPSMCFISKGPELEIAVETCSYFDVEYKVVDPFQHKYLKLYTDYFKSFSSVSTDPAALALLALSENSATEGLRVSLVGDGGDEVLLGYPFFFDDYISKSIKKKILTSLVNFTLKFNNKDDFYDEILQTSIGRHLENVERIPGLLKFILFMLTENERQSLLVNIKKFNDLQEFYLFHVMPESLCRKTDTAGHFCNVELRSPLLQYSFIHYGMDLKFKNEINDYSKKPLKNYLLESNLPLLDKKIGLNVSGSLINKVTKSIIKKSNSDYIFSKSINKDVIFDQIFKLNKKANYAFNISKVSNRIF